MKSLYSIICMLMCLFISYDVTGEEKLPRPPERLLTRYRYFMQLTLDMPGSNVTSCLKCLYLVKFVHRMLILSSIAGKIEPAEPSRCCTARSSDVTVRNVHSLLRKADDRARSSMFKWWLVVACSSDEFVCAYVCIGAFERLSSTTIIPATVSSPTPILSLLP